MRLLTHNSLKCNGKGVVEGFPLGLEIIDLDVIETEMNIPFLIDILPTLDWRAVCIGAKAVGIDGVPAVFDPSILRDPNFLKAMHNLLFDVHVVKGVMTCPESGRKFPIEEGIPRMM